ncbi:MAG: helix-hairpin-helix domain-containing protein [Blautia sp.]|nr:helix-hairpin-helix domain-containing protein [Blautia sp.]
MNSNEAVNRFLYRPVILSMICICIFSSSGCTSRTERFLEENTEAFTVEEQSDTGEEEKTEEQDEQASAVPSIIYVDVCGHVERPGVYTFTEGSRIYEAIEAAGGFTEDAAVTAVNRAEFLSDAMQLYIPSQEEFCGAGDQAMPEVAAAGAAAEIDDGLIDLNTAGMDQLCELPGIGESKASAILAYRDKYGPFSSIDELMQVNGIKEGTFAKIKDRIAIR